jgi:hypothetical protein
MEQNVPSCEVSSLSATCLARRNQLLPHPSQGSLWQTQLSAQTPNTDRSNLIPKHHVLLCVVLVVIQYLPDGARDPITGSQSHGLFLHTSLLRAISVRPAKVVCRCNIINVASPGQKSTGGWHCWASKWVEVAQSMCMCVYVALHRRYYSAMRVQSEGMRQHVEMESLL